MILVTLVYQTPCLPCLSWALFSIVVHVTLCYCFYKSFLLHTTRKVQVALNFTTSKKKYFFLFFLYYLHRTPSTSKEGRKK